MATSRKKRRVDPDPHATHDTHVDGEVHGEYPKNWKPPAHLEAPKARPNMVQRWVRMSVRGEADPKNLHAQVSQGWRPRSFQTVPPGERKQYPTASMDRYGEVMTSGDLVLCEMPKRLYDEMKDFYAKKRKNQVGALVQGHIDQTNNNNDPEHGFGEITMTRRSKVVTRQPIVAADPEE